jgi:hypothetical protein
MLRALQVLTVPLRSHDDSGLPFSLAGLNPECRVSKKAKRFFAKNKGVSFVMDLRRQEQQIKTSPRRRARDAS